MTAVTTRKSFDLAKRIREIQEQLGLSQSEFAERIGVTRAALNRWCNGKAQPLVTQVAAIAEVANLSIDEVVYGTDKMARATSDSTATINQVMSLPAAERGKIALALIEDLVKREEGKAVSEDYLPFLPFKAARRLKNLLLEEGSRRGWGVDEFERAGCDRLLYKAIVGETEELCYEYKFATDNVSRLAVLLPKVEKWDDEQPTVLARETYASGFELWQAISADIVNGAKLIH